MEMEYIENRVYNRKIEYIEKKIEYIIEMEMEMEMKMEYIIEIKYIIEMEYIIVGGNLCI